MDGMPAQFERELRDGAPRRVRLTRAAWWRRWFLINAAFALLFGGSSLLTRFAAPLFHQIRHWGAFGPIAIVAGLLLIAAAPLFFLLDTGREMYLLREGIPAVATVTERYGSVLHGADTFAIQYRLHLPADLGGGTLQRAFTVDPMTFQHFPKGTTLTVLVHTRNPSFHRPYFAFRNVMIEGAPNRKRIS